MHRKIIVAVLALIVGMFSTPAAAEDTHSSQWLDVEQGQSYVFKVNRAIGRVLISDADVAEIKLLEQGQVQIRGIQSGSTDLWIWYQNDMLNPVSYQLTVHRDLADLVRRIDSLVDGTPPRIYPLLERIVVEGPVANVETLERIVTSESTERPSRGGGGMGETAYEATTRGPRAAGSCPTRCGSVHATAARSRASTSR